ncbi:MAG: hypothetical protein ACK55Z_24990 [bacterium]
MLEGAAAGKLSVQPASRTQPHGCTHIVTDAREREEGFVRACASCVCVYTR